MFALRNSIKILNKYDLETTNDIDWKLYMYLVYRPQTLYDILMTINSFVACIAKQEASEKQVLLLEI